jgi:hypothetical protein
MATPVGDPAEVGVRAGIARSERYGLGVEFVYADGEPQYSDELQLPLSFTRELFETGGASARFCELFAEILTVAAIARSHYDDEPLTESLIRDYLAQSFTFLNSYRHA